jgi:hypothetical protein
MKIELHHLQLTLNLTDLNEEFAEIADSAQEEVEESEESPFKDDEENKGPDGLDLDKLFAKDASTLPYKVGDVKSASNWLQKTLGVTPSVAEGLIKVSGYDSPLFGYFYRGAITLSDILEEGTEYHEAYHLVSLMYLTSSQRKLLYNEVRKREGNKNLTDKQAEEILAEDFREYVITDGKQMYPEVQKNIFQKISKLYSIRFQPVSAYKHPF